MTESLADRWIRGYEAKHPEKARARYTSSLPLGSPLPSPACPPQTRAVPASPPPPPRSDGPWQAHTDSLVLFPPTTPPASQNVQAVVQAAIALRREWGLTQAEFACRLGISPRTWQEWEQGRRTPSGPGRVLLQQVVATRLAGS